MRKVVEGREVIVLIKWGEDIKKTLQKDLGILKVIIAEAKKMAVTIKVLCMHKEI